MTNSILLFYLGGICEFGGRMSMVVDAPSWDEVGVCARDEVPGIYDIEDITEVKEVK